MVKRPSNMSIGEDSEKKDQYPEIYRDLLNCEFPKDLRRGYSQITGDDQGTVLRAARKFSDQEGVPFKQAYSIACGVYWSMHDESRG